MWHIKFGSVQLSLPSSPFIYPSFCFPALWNGKSNRCWIFHSLAGTEPHTTTDISLSYKAGTTSIGYTGSSMRFVSYLYLFISFRHSQLVIFWLFVIRLGKFAPCACTLCCLSEYGNMDNASAVWIATLTMSANCYSTN